MHSFMVQFKQTVQSSFLSTNRFECFFFHANLAINHITIPMKRQVVWKKTVFYGFNVTAFLFLQYNFGHTSTVSTCQMSRLAKTFDLSPVFVSYVFATAPESCSNTIIVEFVQRVIYTAIRLWEFYYKGMHLLK